MGFVWLRYADAMESIRKEILMRIPTLAIWATISVLAAAPLRPKHMAGMLRSAYNVGTGAEAKLSTAAIARWRSATPMHRASPPCALPIHILQTHKCHGNQPIGSLVAPTRSDRGATTRVEMADASGEPAPRSDLARAAYAGAEAKIR